MTPPCEGILLVDKPRGKTSFSLISALRRRLGVKKIGHAGTLDPFATGLMILLVGRRYTQLSNRFLTEDKEYIATVRLGIATDSFDCDGEVISVSNVIPTQAEIEEALTHFQGEVEQTPPMFSAKKQNGKKLYELARKGVVVERKAVKVRMKTEQTEYAYPFLHLKIACSKGTYIRALADDLGKMLGCGAHLSDLERTQCGGYHVDEAIQGERLFTDDDPEHIHLQRSIPQVKALV